MFTNIVVLIIAIGYSPSSNTTRPLMEVLEYRQADMATCDRQAARINKDVATALPFRQHATCVERMGLASSE
jgi:hypothetical protein